MNGKRLVVVIALALAACGPSVSSPATHPTPTPSASTRSPSPTLSPHPTIAPDICTSRNGLPDPTCTPGAINPDVTQATIQSTICMRGWTATIRPPQSYTGPIKLQLMRAYQYYNGHSTTGYELDHLVSLELGGSARDIANLWPEAPGSPNAKDKVENKTRALICSGKMTLADGQKQIATNWKALAVKEGLPTS